MNLSQRQARLERFFAALARSYALSLGLEYLGTIRQLPPPPLPGELLGVTRYYVNGLAPKGGGTRLVEFSPPLYASVRRAEAWVATGRGPAPEVPGRHVRAASRSRSPLSAGRTVGRRRARPGRVRPAP